MTDKQIKQEVLRRYPVEDKEKTCAIYRQYKTNLRTQAEIRLRNELTTKIHLPAKTHSQV